MKNLNAKIVAWLTLLFAGIYNNVAVSDWESPRTEYNHPDLQGVWFHGTATPMQRPIALGDQLEFTDNEAQEMLAALAQSEADKTAPLSGNRSAPETGANIAQEADHNFATSRLDLVYIDGKYRTSQIISPANGRLPFRDNPQDFFDDLNAAGYGAFDGPETRPASERCVGPNAGPIPPLVSWFYNANLQIVQTRDHVMILTEMNHDARIIPLNRELSVNPSPTWMGTSVGHWDGDTLIVETTGIRSEQSWFAFVMSDELRVTEQFRLTGKDEILYQATFADPKIYTESVTIEKTIRRRSAGEVIYEYACHEGNYSLSSILAGARRQEIDFELTQNR